MPFLSRESNFSNRTHQRAARDKVTDTGINTGQI